MHLSICIHVVQLSILDDLNFIGYLVAEGMSVLPDGRWWRFIYCSGLNVLNLLVCLIGAGMFAKTSVVILATVCVSVASTIISFCVKGPEEVCYKNSMQNLFLYCYNMGMEMCIRDSGGG